jgi:glycosyltransferase involved in cell wall biosynthesis
MPRVSVVIPSYNHEKYIAASIQSVLDQTYQDFEIVITDDSSTDNSVEVIKNFNDPRIKLFCFNKNQGAAVSTNNSIQESKGEFIAILNSDDIFVADKLRKQVSFLDNNPQFGAVFAYPQVIDEEGNLYKEEHFYRNIFIQNNRTRFEWLRYFFLNGNCLCHPSILIRKDCYHQVGLYDVRLAQLPDFDFWIRLCMKYDIYILPEKLVKFRIFKNEISASGNRPEVKIRSTLEFTQVLKNYTNTDVLDNFFQVFPESLSTLNIEEKPDELSKEIMLFYIAQLAIKIDNPAAKYFGIDIFYQLLKSNENTVNKIGEHFSFGYIDLIKLAGNQDIFSVVSLTSTQLKELETLKSIVQNSKIWRLWMYWIKLKTSFLTTIKRSLRQSH